MQLLLLKFQRTMAVSAFVLIAASLIGQDGALDSSFAQNGVFTPPATPVGSAFYKTALQQDGKIIVVGVEDRQPVVWRLLENGMPDPDFGAGGKTNFSVGQMQASAQALRIQSDGKIVLFGQGADDDFQSFAFLTRLLPNGDLDASLGGNGVVLYPQYVDVHGFTCDVAVQADGKIIGMLPVAAPDSINLKMGLIRYKPDGSLDSLFGNAGLLVPDISPGLTLGSSIVLQANGKILLSGTCFDLGSLFVARLLPDGSPDPQFGQGGKVITNISTTSYSIANQVLESPEGGAFVSGYYVNNFSFELYVIKLDANGNFVPGFGANGVAKSAFSNLPSSSISDGYMAIDHLGRVLLGGTMIYFGVDDWNFALLRFLPDGTLDSSFGDNGMVHKDITDHSQDAVLGISWQPKHNKVIVCGSANAPLTGAVVQYNNGMASPATEPGLNISVFPNPANTEINVTGENLALVQQVRLLDILGKEMLRVESPLAERLMIPTGLVRNGYYFLEITTDARTSTIPVFIRH